MTPREALALVRKRGIVLEAGHGQAPSVAEAVAGEPIRGSWWSHPKSHEIFAVTRAVRDSHEVLVCRLIDGKITFVHRRLWPALVRLSRRLPRKGLAEIREEHTPQGTHRMTERPFPRWVPKDAFEEAKELSEEAAAAAIGDVLVKHLTRKQTRTSPH